MTDWRSFPKVELHLHLEGAAPPALVRRLAAERNLDLSGLFAGDGGYAWTDFSEFLDAYDAAAAVFDTPEANRDLAEAVLRDCAAHGVLYAELFLSPDHGGDDPVAWAEHLAAVTEGAEAAEAATGIVARYIPLCVRGLGPDRALEVADLVAKVGHPRVVGFGMAGDERLFHPRDFAPAFAAAREAGLRLTAHAGEFGGAGSVRAALDELGIERVGHGVRAIEDPGLVARIAAEGVTLEVCPGSNISLGVFPDWPFHSLPRLRDAGARVTISTDDPPFFRTDMTREYRMAEAVFGLSEDDLRAITLAGIDAAFCDAATRAALRARVGG